MGPVDVQAVLTPPLSQPRRRIGGVDFDFSRQIAVMAVVNRTPDSFYDQGATFGLDAAVQACLRAAADGADWIDIGGAKFAPGPEIPAAEELDRVVPVVREVHRRVGTPISVDTFRPEVARAAIAAGAAIINDTTGLHDPELGRIVADSDAAIVITHSLAEPRRPYPHPQYADIGREVADVLRERVALAIDLGIPADRIVVDPGHDLNKTTRQTLELTRRLPEVCALGYPVLAAVSNKDFVGETLGRDRHERLAGSLAAAVTSVLLGARIVRMHEVRESVDAMRMVAGILGWREPAFERHNL
jgi:dihydropteroate synthase